MGLVIPGIIAFIIYFIVQISSKSNIGAYSEYTPREKSPAILAKEHNRKLRQEKERLEDEDLMRRHTAWKNRKTTGPKSAPKKALPFTWFIGTWGIKEPSHAEQLIIDELRKYNIEWYREVSFSNLLLPSGGYPRFDFYFPDHQTAIEYQGQGYHESPERISSDKLKAKFCKDNNITLLTYDVQHYRTMEQTIADLMRSLHIRLK